MRFPKEYEPCYISYNMSQNLVTCTKCEEEVKRSTAIFGDGKEFPQLVEDEIVENDDDVSLCYDCYSELK